VVRRYSNLVAPSLSYLPREDVPGWVVIGLDMVDILTGCTAAASLILFIILFIYLF
jgi:hypothetical protein